MTLRGGSNKIAKIRYHVRENVFLVASVVATISLLAVIMPLSLSIQDNAQALVQTSTGMENHNSMTSPQHDMAMMVMGQDTSMMNSEHPKGSLDYSIPNQP